MNLRLLGGVLAMLAAALPSGAQVAQDWTDWVGQERAVRPSRDWTIGTIAGTRLVYTDNVFKTVKDQGLEADLGMQPFVGGSVRFAQPFFQAGLWILGDYNFYLSTPGARDGEARELAWLEYREGRDAISFTDSLRFENEPAPGILVDRTNRFHHDAGLRGSKSVTPRVTLDAGFDYKFANFRAAEFDSGDNTSTEATLGFSYEYKDKAFYLVEAGLGRLDYRQDVLRDSTGSVLRIGSRGQLLSRLAGELKIGFAWRRTDDDPVTGDSVNYAGPEFAATLSWQLSESSTVSLQGRRTTASAQTGDFQVNSFFGASLLQDFSATVKGRFAVQAERATTLGGADTDRLTLRGAVSWPVGPSLYADAAVQLRLGRTDQSSIDYTETVVSAGLTYRP